LRTICTLLANPKNGIEKFRADTAWNRLRFSKLNSGRIISARRAGRVRRAAQIVVVNGIQKALKIIARMFVRSGTPVAIEDPCPRGALSTSESYGAEFANCSYYVVLHNTRCLLARGSRKTQYGQLTGGIAHDFNLSLQMPTSSFLDCRV
jgi:hypothetical protein